MERFGFVTSIFALLVFGIGDLSGSLADPVTSLPPDAPTVPNIPSRVQQRIRVMIAIILGFIIVPAGLIAIVFFALNHCVNGFKARRASKRGDTASTEDINGVNDPRNWSYMMSDSDDEKKVMSLFYMYVNTADEIKLDFNGNLANSKGPNNI